MDNIVKNNIFEDPIVEEVRKAGEEIVKKCDNDFHKFCEYLRKDEKKNAEKYVSRKPKHLLKRTGTIN